MLKQKRAEGPVVVVEAGLSLAPVRGGAPGAVELDQRRIKADLIAESWAKGGVDAIAVGGTDWTLGVDFVRGLVERHHLPLLAANLTCGGSRPYPASKVVEIDGRRIGVIGVTTGAVEGCEVEEVAPAMDRARAELGRVDLAIGLLPLGKDAEVAAAGALPVDLVIDARGRFVQAGAERRGEAWFVGAGSRGKALGVLSLTFRQGSEGWAPDGEDDRLAKQIDVVRARLDGIEKRLAKGGDDDAARQRLQGQRDAYARNLAELEAGRAKIADPGAVNRFRLADVVLDEQIADDPEVKARVDAAKAKVTSSAGSEAGRFVPRVVADEGSPFAGGEVCVGCHAAEHAQWSTTGHARAWQTLVTVDRAFDADCWTCHVTGASAEGGPPSAPGSGPWRDVQCEACHGPSRAHVAAPQQVDAVKTPSVETCTACHDGRKDEGRFDPATYLPRVSH